jgi:hypothetical protein
VSVPEFFVETVAFAFRFWDPTPRRQAKLEDAKPEFQMFRLREQVRSTHNQDGAVVLDILHGQMFRLNLVGSRMLELLKQGHTETEIVEQVGSEFSVDREIVASDLHEFLAHLEKNYLLAVIPSAL